MSPAQRIDSLTALGISLTEMGPARAEAVQESFKSNHWFTPGNVEYAIDAVCRHYLEPGELAGFASPYPEPAFSRTVAIVMPGNVPLAGFHDLLCVLLSGHRAMVKVSSREPHLIPFTVSLLNGIDASLAGRVIFRDRLSGFDAVIATGSNNSGRYFRYYFGKYPCIIRGNRGSVAVLSGGETQQQLENLGEDVFLYFGLGCRNVSKVFVPEGFDVERLIPAFSRWSFLKDHNSYRNNLDYNLTLLLMNKLPHLASDFIILRENREIISPVGVLHYEFYRSPADVRSLLEERKHEIQCVAGKGFTEFGKCQQPGLADFADGVDTMKFLSELE